MKTILIKSQNGKSNPKTERRGSSEGGRRELSEEASSVRAKSALTIQMSRANTFSLFIPLTIAHAKKEVFFLFAQALISAF
ncbi:MAG: Uncharacterised protein [Flavobacteriia bacterium]|nr:MAG: Uncharacterised protein [Flavobacteriia bacterium]